jgi:hypothetical protein
MNWKNLEEETDDIVFYLHLGFIKSLLQLMFQLIKLTIGRLLRLLSIITLAICSTALTPPFQTGSGKIFVISGFPDLLTSCFAFSHIK